MTARATAIELREHPEHWGRIVRAEVMARAAAERAWLAWADPERLSGWLTDRARGRARPGATMVWCFDRFRSEFPYEVVAAEEGRRLVLKGSPPGRPPYVLEVLTLPEGEDTRVKVINSGFSAGPDSDDEYEGVVSGWNMALAILKEYLERHEGQPRASFFAMQPASFDYEAILRYFLDESGLSLWLTRQGSIGCTGGAYRLVLRDGSTMSGRVLTRTTREVAVTWDEIDGVAELKAFRLGPRARAVAVRGCGWNLTEERAAAIDAMLAKAIDRLVAALVDSSPAG